MEAQPQHHQSEVDKHSHSSCWDLCPVFILEDSDPEVRLAWHTVFAEYVDVWSGLPDPLVARVKRHFHLRRTPPTQAEPEPEPGPVDLFVFPCCSNCTPVSTQPPDLLYMMQFGDEIQRIQARLSEPEGHYYGELLVGQAILEDITYEPVDTSHHYLAALPVMRVPMDVSDSLNAYFAFRALLIAVKKHNSAGRAPIKTVLCPSLGCRVGGIPPLTSAIQMLHAYMVVALGHPPKCDSIISHRRLCLNRKVGQEEELRARLKELRTISQSLRDTTSHHLTANEDEDGDETCDQRHDHHHHDQHLSEKERHVCRGMVRYPSDFSSSSEECSDPYDFGVN